LRSWIATEVADATGAFINGLGQIFWWEPLFIPDPVSMRPILAEKTVKGTSMVEDGEVFKPIFRTVDMGIFGISSTRSTRADPIRYTIGWKAIIIPTNISLAG
jgi:hypothetical protein